MAAYISHEIKSFCFHYGAWLRTFLLPINGESSRKGKEHNNSTDTYLCQQKGDSSKGKGPAIFVAEISLITFTSIQHLVIDAGDVKHETHHQRQA